MVKVVLEDREALQQIEDRLSSAIQDVVESNSALGPGQKKLLRNKMAQISSCFIQKVVSPSVRCVLVFNDIYSNIECIKIVMDVRKILTRSNPLQVKRNTRVLKDDWSDAEEEEPDRKAQKKGCFPLKETHFACHHTHSVLCRALGARGHGAEGASRSAETESARRIGACQGAQENCPSENEGVAASSVGAVIGCIERFGRSLGRAEAATASGRAHERSTGQSVRQRRRIDCCARRQAAQNPPARDRPRSQHRQAVPGMGAQAALARGAGAGGGRREQGQGPPGRRPQSAQHQALGPVMRSAPKTSSGEEEEHQAVVVRGEKRGAQRCRNRLRRNMESRSRAARPSTGQRKDGGMGGGSP
eukprot:2976440-Rhodomonas_salina.2